MSLQSPCELVKPHATCVLLPTTTAGTPGSVTPINRCGGALASSCHSSDARYHVFGTRTVRCMSLASRARPSLVSRPDTAQLLLPIDSSRLISNSQFLASCSIGRGALGVDSLGCGWCGGRLP